MNWLRQEVSSNLWKSMTNRSKATKRIVESCWKCHQENLRFCGWIHFWEVFRAFKSKIAASSMQQSCDFKVQHNFLLTEKIISHLIIQLFSFNSATVGLKFFQHCLSSCSAPKHKNTSILSVYQQAEKGAYECVMSIASCFKHSSSVCSAFSVFSLV